MTPTSLADFTQWQIQPQATRLIEHRLAELAAANPWLASLSDCLLRRTGTKLVDWIDTIHLSTDSDLTACGFASIDPYGVDGRLHHPGAQLPWVIADGQQKVVLRVESVVDFLRAQSILIDTTLPPLAIDEIEIIGDATAARRSATVSTAGGVEVVVLERHGDQGPATGATASSSASGAEEAQPSGEMLLWHTQRLRLRPRRFDDPVAGIEQTTALVESIIVDLGVDRTCDLFFQTEREYWQLRNDAANLQFQAQSRLGFGWANHDHHTYRSSRAGFAALVRLLETLGMHCRERFYAGADAGWGAQVLEQPAARIVVFADVDMTADEVLGDFAHQGFDDSGSQTSSSRGTVGLWCDLHGEAVLAAGMHHLECQFAFEAARERLQSEGAESLQPFSDFAYLKQSFTRGQVWPVDERRISHALQNGWINSEQADRFRRSGVTGSHLEVLERNDGYKGFNQTGISDIISRTDPRNVDIQ
ncbi:hypothetical protein SH139x_005254 [Planctomycetaceae bacterium SH139]